MSNWVSVVLIECLVHIIGVKIPHIVRRDFQLRCFTADFAEEKNVTIARLDRPLRFITEFLYGRMIRGQKLGVQVEHGGRTNNVRTNTPTARPFSMMICSTVASQSTSPPKFLSMDEFRMEILPVGPTV